MNRHLLTALLAVALLTAACGGDGGDEEAAMFAAAGDTAEGSDETATASGDGTSGDGTASADGSPGIVPVSAGTFRLNDSELTDDEVGQAVGAYQQFLDAKNRFRIDDVSESDELTAMASSGVVNELIAWRDGQYEVEESLDAPLTGRRSQANVMNVVGTADELKMHDCIEVEESTEFFGPTTTSASLVDQVVTMSHSGTGWVVQAIDIRHSGGFDSQGLGCVPDYHVPRLSELLTEFHVAMDAMAASPEDGVPEVVANFLPEDQVPALAEQMQQQVDEGIVLTESADYTYEVLGSAPEYGNRSFVVAICTTYPDGLSSRDVGTGDVIEQGVAPGSQSYYEAVVTSLPNDEGVGFTNRLVDAVNARNGC